MEIGFRGYFMFCCLEQPEGYHLFFELLLHELR